MSSEARHVMAAATDPTNAAGAQGITPVKCNAAGALDLTPTSFVAVTANDSTTYTPPLRGVYVGTGGTVVLNDGVADFTFTNVANGQTLIGTISKVKTTGTTASGFVGLR